MEIAIKKQIILSKEDKDLLLNAHSLIQNISYAIDENEGNILTNINVTSENLTMVYEILWTMLYVGKLEIGKQKKKNCTK